MRYLKTYESYGSLETEIREILSDITDDGEFTIVIRSNTRGGRYDSIREDEDDFYVNIYQKEDKLFSWEEVKGPVQMLINTLKDRYPLVSTVDINVSGIHSPIQLKNDDNGELYFDTQSKKLIKRVICMFVR